MDVINQHYHFLILWRYDYICVMPNIYWMAICPFRTCFK